LKRITREAERARLAKELRPQLTTNQSKMIGSSNLSFSTLGVLPGHGDLPDLFRALAKHFCKDGIVEATSAVRGFVYDLFKQVITPNRLIDFSKRSPGVYKEGGTRSMPVHTFLTEGSRTS